MQKAILLGLVAMSALTCEAQKSKVPYWLDPAMNRVGVQAPRSDFLPLKALMRHNMATKSSLHVTCRSKVSGNSIL